MMTLKNQINPSAFSHGYAFSTATFDSTRKYRWTLERVLDKTGKASIAFIGLNPSTADENKDDPTVKRCAMRAGMWGYSRFFMLNIFGYRSTDPKVLRQVNDPVGTDNDRSILEVAGMVDRVVVAWGNHGLYLDRGAAVMEALSPLAPKLFCLGVTALGSPTHPLYVPYSTEPEPYQYFLTRKR